jgi:hypothetical protein
MPDKPDLQSFLADLPAAFREMRPYWGSETSRALASVAFKGQTVGWRAVFGQIPLPEFRDLSLERLANSAESNEIAEKIFRDVASELILRGTPLPPTARSLAAQIIAGTWARKKKRGKPLQDHLVRDYFISLQLRTLVEEYGLTPTRNREQKTKRSACSIVHEALIEAGVHMLSERAVEKIWEKVKRNMPSSEAIPD